MQYSKHISTITIQWNMCGITQSGTKAKEHITLRAIVVCFDVLPPSTSRKDLLAANVTFQCFVGKVLTT